MNPVKSSQAINQLSKVGGPSCGCFRETEEGMRVEYSHRFQRAASRSPRDAPDHLSGWLTLHSKDRFKTNVIMSFGFQYVPELQKMTDKFLG